MSGVKGQGRRSKSNWGRFCLHRGWFLRDQRGPVTLLTPAAWPHPSWLPASFSCFHRLDRNDPAKVTWRLTDPAEKLVQVLGPGSLGAAVSASAVTGIGRGFSTPGLWAHPGLCGRRAPGGTGGGRVRTGGSSRSTGEPHSHRMRAPGCGPSGRGRGAG